MALAEGVHSYRHVKNLTERLVDEALARVDAEPESADALTQSHRLIRPSDVYADLFARIAGQCAEPSTLTEEPPQP